MAVGRVLKLLVTVSSSVNWEQALPQPAVGRRAATIQGPAPGCSVSGVTLIPEHPAERN